MAGRLDQFAKGGGIVLATGRTGQYTQHHGRRQKLALSSLGVERIGCIGQGIISAYFLVEEKEKFPHFECTDYVYLHDIYCYAEYATDVKRYMKLIPPHRHSPVEEAYPTNITEYPAFTVNGYGAGKGVFIPWQPGAEYHRMGFSNMENFMADVLGSVLKQRGVGGNLPPMVEVTHTIREETGIEYVHLINNTGFFCNSYFEPMLLRDLVIELPWEKEAPAEVFSMVSDKPCRYDVQAGRLYIYIDKLKLFEAFRIRSM